MKRYLIPTIAAFIALAGCSKDAQEQKAQPADSGNVHALSVEIESGAYQDAGGETKASMEAVIRVKWKQNDSVSVVNATKNKLLGGCLKAQSDGESVVFEGTVTGTIDQGDRLYYIYPRVEGNTEEKAFADYNISLANQKYDGNKISDVCFYGYAEELAGSGSENGSTSISRKIKFTLVTSYAHLNMANLPVKSTSLSRIDISNVNEGFTWTLSGGELSAAAYAGKDSISVRCINANITSYGNAVARFAIPASAETANARVVTVNNAYTNNMYTKLELPAASYYNQLYTTWTENKAEVNTTEDPNKTKVTINNNNSKDVAEGAIPTEAFGTTGQDSKPTEISIGGMGTITFDKDATSRILENASGSTSVLFKVEDVTTTKPVKNADIVYEVTMKTLDEHGTEVFPDAKGTAAEDTPGRATMSIPLGENVAYVHTITLVDSDGNPIDGGVIPESIDLTNHILSFDVEHFSKYAVGYVTEKDFVSVTGVTLDDSSVTLAVEETKTLTATVAPEEATNKKVKWSSSDEAVATVDKDGKVTAVAAGTATITVTTEDGNFAAVCLVTVTPPAYVKITMTVGGQEKTYKWATQNLAVSESGKAQWKSVCLPGTTTPVQIGDYFQWGAYSGYCGDATDPDKGLLIYESFTNNGSFGSFSWKRDDYQFDKYSISPYYNSSYQKYNPADGIVTLAPSDDVASILLGSAWRTPTTDEFQALKDATYWKWDDTGKGYYVYAPQTGDAGKVNNGSGTYAVKDALLFFPATGYGLNYSLDQVGYYGVYRSSTLTLDKSEDYGDLTYAYRMYLNPYEVVPQSPASRHDGYPVRPVCPVTE